MVRCHGNRTPVVTTTPTEPSPPELIKVVDQPTQNDYIALLLGDDEDQLSADRSVVTFLAVPTDSLQVISPFILNRKCCNICLIRQDPGVNGDSNVCVLLHASGSQEASTSSTGHAHIVWSWQTTSPIKTGEECSEFSQSTINMRDLEQRLIVCKFFVNSLVRGLCTVCIPHI